MYVSSSVFHVTFVHQAAWEGHTQNIKPLIDGGVKKKCHKDWKIVTLP
jgi:hypothetical protein